jgi:formylglycine-generating enzyme required for sulfatase activity
MTQPDATQLHAFLVDHFNLEELKTLCFNLGVEFEDLGGEGRSDKARELVKAMQRRTRLAHLVAHLSIAHPDAYRQRFHETPAIPAAPARARRNPQQVFISHAHQDAAFARRLAGDLRARGFPIWIAPDSIRIGEDWPDAIDRGLDESGIIVVALTPEALTSYWVRKETSTARLLAGRGLVEFILLDVAECDPPSAWSTYQFASFRSSYERGLNELLRRLAGEDPRPNPLPPGEGTNRRIHAKTGIELIRIPAGLFLYGSADSDKMAFDDEKPQRTVDLPEYWIGRAPVTNDQFARFVRATGHKTTAERQGNGWAWTGEKWEQVKGVDWLHPGGPTTSSAGKGNHPVVQVSWDDAQAFCEWAGLALPTEEQWEKAARGTDGRIWPWGNEPPTAGHCNFNWNVGDTTPVGQYSPQGDSPFGCVDMAGNVWEWTTSWYDPTQSGRVLRGGSWDLNLRLARVSFRFNFTPDLANLNFGFRPVAPVVSGS